jgi:cobalt/nickel transport system permease protein
MPNPVKALYNIRLMDDMARGTTFIHRRHPLAKFVVTIGFLIAVISFDKYEIINLIPFIFYPVLLVILSEIPAVPVIRRILMVEPFIIALGIFSPLFDRQSVMIGSVGISAGWLAFLSILIKCSLTVAAVILLIATTGMEKLAVSLRMLHIPRIFVLQLLLTYRYISLLAEEVSRLLSAHALRTPGHKGVARAAWGSLAGGLLLRSFDRAQRVYEAMCLRGFNGEYNVGRIGCMNTVDISYTVIWLLLFTISRLYNLPVLLGTIITGVLG